MIAGVPKQQMRILVIHNAICVRSRSLHRDVIPSMSGLIVSGRISVNLVRLKIGFAAKYEHAYRQRREAPPSGARFEDVTDLLEPPQNVAPGTAPAFVSTSKWENPAGAIDPRPMPVITQISSTADSLLIRARHISLHLSTSPTWVS